MTSTLHQRNQADHTSSAVVTGKILVSNPLEIALLKPGIPVVHTAILTMSQMQSLQNDHTCNPV